MISTPSRLTERHRTLVLDASVVINLLGSGRPADVLRLLGRQTVVEERALAEVRRDPSNGRPAQEALNALQMAGLIRCERLSRQGYPSFLALTGAAPPDDLDDGEAATIAHADDIAATPVLDDKKAARICADRTERCSPPSTCCAVWSSCQVCPAPNSRTSSLRPCATPACVWRRRSVRGCGR
jgi:predicted nucleic acid-binding protein